MQSITKEVTSEMCPFCVATPSFLNPSALYMKAKKRKIAFIQKIPTILRLDVILELFFVITDALDAATIPLTSQYRTHHVAGAFGNIYAILKSLEAH